MLQVCGGVCTPGVGPTSEALGGPLLGIADLNAHLCLEVSMSRLGHASRLDKSTDERVLADTVTRLHMRFEHARCSE